LITQPNPGKPLLPFSDSLCYQFSNFEKIGRRFLDEEASENEKLEVEIRISAILETTPQG
jgi:hypothetical protein